MKTTHLKLLAGVAVVAVIAVVNTAIPYGQFMGNVSGTIVDEEWNLGAALSNRTPGDGRTIIVHFASGSGMTTARKNAIKAAHDTWEGIVAVSMDDTPTFAPSPTYGSGFGDGRNAHSFNASDVLWGGTSTLAFAPNITNVSTGQITEADIYFNPRVKWDTSGAPSGTKVDVQSVAFHEFGHCLGLAHSGVTDATMAPYIQAGIASRSPEPDDNISPTRLYARDAGDTALATGGISGRIATGSDSNNGTVCALVFAFSTAEEPITSFNQAYAQAYSGHVEGQTLAYNNTGANSGYYEINGLPNGNYYVYVVPTGDGLIQAGQINDLCAAHAEAGFQREWWNGAGESGSEPDLQARTAITVSGGAITTGINILTQP